MLANFSFPIIALLLRLIQLSLKFQYLLMKIISFTNGSITVTLLLLLFFGHVTGCKKVTSSNGSQGHQGRPTKQMVCHFSHQLPFSNIREIMDVAGILFQNGLPIFLRLLRYPRREDGWKLNKHHVENIKRNPNELGIKSMRPFSNIFLGVIFVLDLFSGIFSQRKGTLIWLLTPHLTLDGHTWGRKGRVKNNGLKDCSVAIT